jgi:hypothetical protein
MRDARHGSSRSVCTSVIVAEPLAPRRVCQSGAALPLVLLGRGHRIAGLKRKPPSRGRGLPMPVLLSKAALANAEVRSEARR